MLIMLTSDQFIQKAKGFVLEYAKEHLDPTDNISITIDDVYVVTAAFILGNQKAMLSTTLPDGMYYEVTYDKNKDAIYFDAYKKFENKCISLSDQKE